MKTPRIYIGALAVFCIAALVIGSAGAAAMMQNGTGTNFKNTGGKGHMNSMANMTQLKEFRTAHPDGFPAFANCTGKGPMTGEANGERMLQMLDNLTAQGYDVSAISAAVTSGDYETAMTLVQEFRTAHPDAFPARGDGPGSRHWGGQRSAE
jgi:ABC-type sugar transport system substrate-binding protein